MCDDANDPAVVEELYRRALDDYARLSQSIRREREAWGRLFEAMAAMHREEMLDEGGHAAHAAREEFYSAKAALVRLGVDPDAAAVPPRGVRKGEAMSDNAWRSRVGESAIDGQRVIIFERDARPPVPYDDATGKGGTNGGPAQRVEVAPDGAMCLLRWYTLGDPPMWQSNQSLPRWDFQEFTEGRAECMWSLLQDIAMRRTPVPHDSTAETPP